MKKAFTGITMLQVGIEELECMISQDFRFAALISNVKY